MIQNSQQLTEKVNSTEETKRQLVFMERAGKYVDQLAQQLGRRPTCCVTTFGCQMNARDSEKLSGILEKAGYELTEDEDADFVIYGHTHVFSHYERHGKVYINPGTAGQDRGDGKSMAVLTLKEDGYKLERIYL